MPLKLFSLQLITQRNSGDSTVPTATCATDLITADKLTTKYQLDATVRKRKTAACLLPTAIRATTVTAARLRALLP